MPNMFIVYKTKQEGLFWCNNSKPCRAPLKNHPENAARAECGSLPSDGVGSPRAHNSNKPASALAPNSFMGSVQGAGFDL